MKFVAINFFSAAHNLSNNQSNHWKQHKVVGIPYVAARPLIQATDLYLKGPMSYTIKIRVVYCSPIEPNHCTWSRYLPVLMTWSEYFHTFQCTKRVEINLFIPLHKSKKYTFQLFLYIHRSQNMQKNQYLQLLCACTHTLASGHLKLSESDSWLV